MYLLEAENLRGPVCRFLVAMSQLMLEICHSSKSKHYLIHFCWKSFGVNKFCFGTTYPGIWQKSRRICVIVRNCIKIDAKLGIQCRTSSSQCSMTEIVDLQLWCWTEWTFVVFACVCPCWHGMSDPQGMVYR